jgi:hypothetical protein
MLHLDQTELDRILTFPALVESLRNAFAGNWTTPLRHHHGMPGLDNSGTEIEIKNTQHLIVRESELLGIIEG